MIRFDAEQRVDTFTAAVKIAMRDRTRYNCNYSRYHGLEGKKKKKISFFNHALFRLITHEYVCTRLHRVWS